VKSPSALASIDAAGADVKQFADASKPLPSDKHPGTRRLKVPFDGDWLSLRSKNRTRRTKRMAASVQLWLAQNLNRRA
jgi:hypothetical protein